MEHNVNERIVFDVIKVHLKDKSTVVTRELPLIGNNQILDSLTLVELCLALEDLADHLGFEFDWTSEAAMSRSRSMFRTAGTLVDEFVSQMESQK